MKKDRQEPRIENVYQLEGRVPVAKAIPFGLQHVLAMFVANIAPLIIIASVAVYNGQPFSVIETARLLQNCMKRKKSDAYADRPHGCWPCCSPGSCAARRYGPISAP